MYRSKGKGVLAYGDDYKACVLEELKKNGLQHLATFDFRGLIPYALPPSFLDQPSFKPSFIHVE